ncbi:hypothetical protein [Acidisphaera sp. L21]|uniref:hypothetical protein n=1 Tax=Acidisphaera sp. L21 TaxID=1641851 RepID=UPI00131C1A40|nr:hypothetical protein [Acidisphaera sp. L21]
MPSSALRLEQLREAAKPAGPVRLDRDRPAVGEAHPWRSDVEEAFVLEEMEMPQMLDPSVIHRILANDAGRGEVHPDDEIEADVWVFLAASEAASLTYQGLEIPKTALS